MKSNEEQGARLEKLIKSLNFKQLSFAKAVGVSQGFVTNMVNGRKNISYGFQKKLLEKFPHLNVQWLLTGEGEMFLGKNREAAEVEMPESVRRIPEIGTGVGTGVLRELEALFEQVLKNQEDFERRLAAIEEARKRKDG